MAVARRRRARGLGLRLYLPAAALAAGALLSGCGAGAGAAPQRTGTPAAIPAALLRQARPIGRGPRFHPPVAGPVPGRCSRRLGPRRGVHVEVFAADRVVILPAGIGTRRPRIGAADRVSARCYGALVTLDTTGLVLVRPGARLTVGDLFRSWGRRLSRTRLAPFAAPARERTIAFVNGRRWRGPLRGIPLRTHAEIVLEIGPRVPPHSGYAFPPGV